MRKKSTSPSLERAFSLLASIKSELRAPVGEVGGIPETSMAASLGGASTWERRRFLHSFLA